MFLMRFEGPKRSLNIFQWSLKLQKNALHNHPQIYLNLASWLSRYSDEVVVVSQNVLTVVNKVKPSKNGPWDFERPFSGSNATFWLQKS